MDQQQRIDKILEAVETRIGDEVSGLLGGEFIVAGNSNDLVTKQSAFEKLRGKQVCALIDIDGECQGKGCLLIGIKDAIRLGGTLIMLPASELEEAVGREEYSEEIDDSYGEIANIIAGAFTRDFEEMYPESCRFIRKEVELIVPAKVTVASDDPVADQAYYQMSCSMVLDGHPMGDMVMLLPAEEFGLQLEESGSPAITNGDGATGEGAEQQNEGESALDATKSAAKNGGDQDKIDLMLALCGEKAEGEIGALLGVELRFSDLQNRLVARKDFFLDLGSELQVVTEMEITGEDQDTGYFSLGIKDAIQLGGTLIMLPPPELETAITNQEFGDDTSDAYGEVTNILAGVYTSIFEENYSPRLRFIKRMHQEVSPNKAAGQSEPIPDRLYYESSFSLAVNGKQGGRAHMLFPADLLQLQDMGLPDTARAQEVVNDDIRDATEKSGAEESSKRTGAQVDSSKQPARKGKSSAEIEKQQLLVDKLLSTCSDRVVDEVSALLGVSITLDTVDNKFISKEDFFFSEVSGNQIIADFDVKGDAEGKSYLAASMRSAIRIGGQLIMLPSAELESVVAAEEFGEDTTDAYGEVANIIAGVYTGVFEEEYSRQLRFVKNSLQRVAPLQVDIGSDEPLADQDYYLSSMVLSLANGETETLKLLIPSDLLELAREHSEGDQTDPETAFVADTPSDEGGHVSSSTIDDFSKHLDILLISDNEGESLRLQEVLDALGYSSRVLGFKDNIHNYIPGELKAIYLVMKDVDEQAFGTAIKISSACSVPLIAAGPGWTKTKVIKAVKYGVRDILLIPATEEEIKENVSANLLKLAA